MAVQSESNHLVVSKNASVIHSDTPLISVDDASTEDLKTSGTAFASSLTSVRERHKSVQGSSMLTARTNFKTAKPLIIGDTVLTNEECVRRWNDRYAHIDGLRKLSEYIDGNMVGPYARADIFESFHKDKNAMFWTGLCYLIGFGCLQRQASGYSIIYTAAEVAKCLESTTYLGFCCLHTGDVLGAFKCFRRARVLGDPVGNFEKFCEVYGLSSATRQRLTIF